MAEWVFCRACKGAVLIMIYEYALDPKVVATWVNRSDYRYFIEKFGLGQPRTISRYPKSWQRLVWEAYEGQDDIEKTRLTELLLRFLENAARRPQGRFDGGDWLQNTLEEHKDKPFKAILSTINPDRDSAILTPKNIDENQALWQPPRSTVVARRADQMTQAVASLLSTATKIIFVDPHFGPDSPRYQKTLQSFLSAASKNRKSELKTVEYHCQVKAPENYFRKECHSRLPKFIPKGISITFVRWTTKNGGQSLHNRYILTDIGGVSFQHGLDEGKEGDTDDLTILDRENYALRWSQYDQNANVFDLLEEPFELVGEYGTLKL